MHRIEGLRGRNNEMLKHVHYKHYVTQYDN